MKKQVRRNVFETNSSSTHSICLTSRDNLLSIPKSIRFGLDEYGWECNTYHDSYSKADYLYTAIMCTGREEYLDKIKEYLDKNGVGYSFAKPHYYTGTYGTWLDNANIDHTEDLPEIIKSICSDETKLLRYLFSEESFIITGNDNDDEDVDINVDYEHEEYYKGN